jgi:two-component system response regulator VicR
MKALVVEDNPDVTEFVSLALQVCWPDIKVAHTHLGGAAAQLLKTEYPDFVILDLNLPDISGFEVLRQIRLLSTIPVIIVTVRDAEADIVKGLEWGADEYIVKPFRQLALVARVRAALRSRNYNSGANDLVFLGSLRFDPSAGQLFSESAKVLLTRTECLILRTLVKHAGHLVTYSQLAESVWGGTYEHAADTLRVYIRRLRTKVDTNFPGELVIRARPSLGYSLEAPA